MTTYTQRWATAKLAFWLGKRASRNKTPVDRLARRMLKRLLDFEYDLDELVLTHQGFDPDELNRYQHGEIGHNEEQRP